MKKYLLKKGTKILTKKRGMVTNYVTVDDLGSENLLKDLVDNGFISEPSITEQIKKENSRKKAKNEPKNPS